MLSLVVARARNGAIGKDNDIPWHIPADFRLFQRETTGGAVIMGRHTWESLPVKPLPRRLNIVVSSRAPGGEVDVVPSVGAAIALAREAGYPRIYGIGGSRIYSALLPLADRLLVTEVDVTIADADAFFPDFNPADWHLADRYPLTDATPAATVHDYLRRR